MTIQVVQAHPLVAHLRRVRLERGLTLRDIADRTGFHLQQIGAWEVGTYTPRLDHLDRWAEALDLTLDFR